MHWYLHCKTRHWFEGLLHFKMFSWKSDKSESFPCLVFVRWRELTVIHSSCFSFNQCYGSGFIPSGSGSSILAEWVPTDPDLGFWGPKIEKYLQLIYNHFLLVPLFNLIRIRILIQCESAATGLQTLHDTILWLSSAFNVSLFSLLCKALNFDPAFHSNANSDTQPWLPPKKESVPDTIGILNPPA